MSTIKETTLHPDNDPNVDLYPRTLATLVEGLDAAITTKAPRPVACKIVLPQGATKGTLTEKQLTILSASPQNYIEMVNDKELYYLNDPGHESGFYTYSHVGIENSKATIKTLTITLRAKSFVIVTTVVPTEAQEKASKNAEYKKYLEDTDYVVLKIAEAMAEGNESLKQELMLQYAGILAIRKAYRQELNK